MTLPSFSEPEESTLPAPGPSAPEPTPTAAASPHPRRINPWKLFVGAFIPNWLLERTEVSQGAKLCYARLAQFAGKDGHCFPKQETLATELGVGERMARDYIRELVEFGLIETEQHGLGTSNSYHFLHHPWMQAGQPGHQSTSAPDRQPASAQERKDSSGPERQPSSGPVEKRFREENQTTNIERGLPRSEEEAVAAAALSGVPENFARIEFDRMQAVGWLDGTHRPVRSWSHYIKMRWNREQSDGAGRHTNAHASPTPRAPVWQRAQALKDKLAAAIEAHDALDCLGDFHPMAVEAWDEVKRLRSELAKLGVEG